MHKFRIGLASRPEPTPLSRSEHSYDDLSVTSVAAGFPRPLVSESRIVNIED